MQASAGLYTAEIAHYVLFCVALCGTGTPAFHAGREEGECGNLSQGCPGSHCTGRHIVPWQGHPVRGVSRFWATEFLCQDSTAKVYQRQSAFWISRQQKYTSRQQKFDRKSVPASALGKARWAEFLAKGRACTLSGSCLRARAITRPNRFAALAPTPNTPACMRFSCCRTGKPQSFGEGERAAGSIVPFCPRQMRIHCKRTQTADSGVVRGKAPLFQWDRFRNSNLYLSVTHDSPACYAT